MDGYLKIGSLLFFFGLVGNRATAQDCVLDSCGKDQETLVAIFQMNAEQQKELEDMCAHFEVERKTISDDIETLLQSHPQRTEEDLQELARKYAELQEKLVDLVSQVDRSILERFNERQLARYISLCKEAYREPLVTGP